MCTTVTKVLKVLLSTTAMLRSCKGSDYGHSTVGVFGVEWLKAFAKVRDIVTLRLALSAGLRWEVNSGFPHMIMHPVRCSIVQYAWNSWMLSCFSPQVEAWKHLQNHKNIGNRSTFLCLIIMRHHLKASFKFLPTLFMIPAETCVSLWFVYTPQGTEAILLGRNWHLLSEW